MTTTRRRKKQRQSQNDAPKPLKPKSKSFKLEPKNDHQFDLIRSIVENDITFCSGPAGTGKTFISIAMSWQYYERSEVKRIVITRPTVETNSGGKSNKYGALPGSLKDKIDPYLAPIYDEFKHFITPDILQQLIKDGFIEIVPLEFMRGRNFYDSFIILDEAQNCTEIELDMFLSRLAQGSKMVISGDTSQIDLPKHLQGALEDSVKALDGVNGVGVVRFSESDIVRHNLIGPILKRLKLYRALKKENQSNGCTIWPQNSSSERRQNAIVNHRLQKGY